MNVLDHGSVELVTSWGSDEDIIRAARQSTDGAFRGWGPIHGPKCPKTTALWKDMAHHCTCVPTAGDEKLLKYLYTHKHMSPFEMCGATFEVKAPIFVFREWHRHRTQGYNEMSARYIPIPDENYLPDVARLLTQATGNKQAQGTGKVLTEYGAHDFRIELADAYRKAQVLYETALNSGVPKELARLIIPVGRYSKMWASANLRNWMQFLTLRNDAAAQWEIQQYAIAVQDLLKSLFPRTIALFEEEKNGVDEHDQAS